MRGLGFRLVGCRHFGGRVGGVPRTSKGQPRIADEPAYPSCFTAQLKRSVAGNGSPQSPKTNRLDEIFGGKLHSTSDAFNDSIWTRPPCRYAGVAPSSRE